MPKVEDMLMDEQTQTSETPIGMSGEGVNAQSGFRMPALDFLKAQSVDRPIEEYIEHALNFDKKKSTGRIIRGLEGFLGALNYAIIDIIMGLVEKSREKKAGE